ncbi:MAG: zinc metalloprotease HtpX [Chitinivibrionales bacterium]
MNYLKTTLLLGVLTGVLVVFGQLIGGSHGAMMFLIIAAIMNFIAYWFSDKIVLMSYRARQAGPEDAPKLYNVVKRLAERADIPMPKVYIVENPSPNAFATGRNPRHASVAATTGILQILSEEELEGVMAHELSHVRNRDILISSIAATIAGAITLIANVVQWGAMFGGSSRDENDRGNIFVMLAMAILAPIAAMIIQMAISRSREYAADYAGAKLCRKPLALASALGRLENTVRQIPMQGGSPTTAHLFIVNPFRGGVMRNLFSTHPPMEERIRRLERLSREM